MMVSRLPHSSVRAIVVAAHPDDEAIGAGALLATLPQASVVHITHGEPTHGEPRVSERVAVRIKEAKSALAQIGRYDGYVNFEMPAGIVGWPLAAVTQRLAQLFTTRRIELVIAHAYEGGHQDHDATAFVTHAAIELLVREGRRRPTVLEMTSYHGFGGVLNVGTFIPHPGAGSVQRLDVDKDAWNLKDAMMQQYVSQRATLASYARDIEHFRVAPGYNFASPPHPGLLLYERYDFGMPGLRWRELVSAAAAELGLLHPQVV